MTRIAENNDLFKKLDALIDNAPVGATMELVLPLTLIHSDLADISKSLAVIADALNREDR